MLKARRAFAQSPSGSATGRAAGSSASASGHGNNKILVMCPLRGGMDSLTFFPAFGLNGYYRRRPSLGVSADNCLRVGNNVRGMHSMLAPLHQQITLPSGQQSSGVWADGEMALIQKVGCPSASLSHFHSSDVYSTGCTRGSASRAKGWIARMADAHYPHYRSLFSIGSGSMDTPDLRVENPDLRPLSINDLSGFRIQEDHGIETGELNLLQAVAEREARREVGGQRIDARVATGIRRVYTETDYLQAVDQQYDPTVIYPTDDWNPNMGGDRAGATFGANLRTAAKLICVEPDLHTLIVENPVNWDMHVEQARTMGYHGPSIFWALDAFIRDLKTMGRWNDVCIVLYSEFGRSLPENSNGGTDHGVGQTMMVFGGNINGGIYGGQLTERDMNHGLIMYDPNDHGCIDFRSVYSSIIRDHMGYQNVDEILPEAFIDRGLFNQQNQPLFRGV